MDSVAFFALEAFILGAIIGVVIRSQMALFLAVVLGIGYIIITVSGTDAVTEPCNGWCSSQTWSEWVIDVTLVVYITLFGIVPDVLGAVVGSRFGRMIINHD